MKEHRFIQKAVFLLYLAAVAFLCFGHFDSVPQAEITILGIPADKIGHFLMFLPFPVLFYLAFGWHTGSRWRSVVLAVVALAAGCLTAYSTELIQGLTTYRSKDILDFIADTMALVLSSAAVLTYELAQNRNHEE